MILSTDDFGGSSCTFSFVGEIEVLTDVSRPSLEGEVGDFNIAFWDNADIPSIDGVVGILAGDGDLEVVLPVGDLWEKTPGIGEFLVGDLCTAACLAASEASGDRGRSFALAAFS